MNEKRTRKCIVCGKEYEYNTWRGTRGKRSKGSKRGKNTLTCSKKCSATYTRISVYIHKNYKRLLK